MNKMKQFIVSIVFMVGIYPALAQTIVPDLITTSGDFFKTSKGVLSWSIGEPIAETFTGSHTVMTQGVQQSLWIVTPSGIEDEWLRDIKIYPNPVRDNLYVELPHDQSFSISLYDINGRLLFTKERFDTIGRIDLSGIEEKFLILRVSCLNTQKTMNFKIVKTK